MLAGSLLRLAGEPRRPQSAATGVYRQSCNGVYRSGSSAHREKGAAKRSMPTERALASATHIHVQSPVPPHNYLMSISQRHNAQSVIVDKLPTVFTVRRLRFSKFSANWRRQGTETIISSVAQDIPRGLDCIDDLSLTGRFFGAEASDDTSMRNSKKPCSTQSYGGERHAGMSASTPSDEEGRVPDMLLQRSSSFMAFEQTWNQSDLSDGHISVVDSAENTSVSAHSNRAERQPSSVSMSEGSTGVHPAIFPAEEQYLLSTTGTNEGASSLEPRFEARVSGSHKSAHGIQSPISSHSLQLRARSANNSKRLPARMRYPSMYKRCQSVLLATRQNVAPETYTIVQTNDSMSKTWVLCNSADGKFLHTTISATLPRQESHIDVDRLYQHITKNDGVQDMTPHRIPLFMLRPMTDTPESPRQLHTYAPAPVDQQPFVEKVDVPNFTAHGDSSDSTNGSYEDMHRPAVWSAPQLPLLVRCTTADRRNATNTPQELLFKRPCSSSAIRTGISLSCTGSYTLPLRRRYAPFSETMADTSVAAVREASGTSSPNMVVSTDIMGAALGAAKQLSHSAAIQPFQCPSPSPTNDAIQATLHIPENGPKAAPAPPFRVLFYGSSGQEHVDSTVSQVNLYRRLLSRHSPLHQNSYRKKPSIMVRCLMKKLLECPSDVIETDAARDPFSGIDKAYCATQITVEGQKQSGNNAVDIPMGAQSAFSGRKPYTSVNHSLYDSFITAASSALQQDIDAPAVRCEARLTPENHNVFLGRGKESVYTTDEHQRAACHKEIPGYKVGQVSMTDSFTYRASSVNSATEKVGPPVVANQQVESVPERLLHPKAALRVCSCRPDQEHVSKPAPTRYAWGCVIASKAEKSASKGPAVARAIPQACPPRPKGPRSILSSYARYREHRKAEQRGPEHVNTAKPTFHNKVYDTVRQVCDSGTCQVTMVSTQPTGLYDHTLSSRNAIHYPLDAEMPEQLAISASIDTPREQQCKYSSNTDILPTSGASSGVRVPTAFTSIQCVEAERHIDPEERASGYVPLAVDALGRVFMHFSSGANATEDAGIGTLIGDTIDSREIDSTDIIISKYDVDSVADEGHPLTVKETVINRVSSLRLSTVATDDSNDNKGRPSTPYYYRAGSFFGRQDNLYDRRFASNCSTGTSHAAHGAAARNPLLSHLTIDSTHHEGIVGSAARASMTSLPTHRRSGATESLSYVDYYERMQRQRDKEARKRRREQLILSRAARNSTGDSNWLEDAEIGSSLADSTTESMQDASRESAGDSSFYEDKTPIHPVEAQDSDAEHESSSNANSDLSSTLLSDLWSQDIVLPLVAPQLNARLLRSRPHNVRRYTAQKRAESAKTVDRLAASVFPALAMHDRKWSPNVFRLKRQLDF